MAQLQMKWRNINVAVRLKVTNGAVWAAALVFALVYAVLTKWVKPMADNFIAGEAAIWAISATFMKYQVDNNKLDVEAAKANVGDKLNRIKAAAAGIGTAEPCDDPSKGAPVA